MMVNLERACLVLLIVSFCNRKLWVSAQSEVFKLHMQTNVTTKDTPDLQQFSLISALANIAKDQNVNSVCFNELELIRSSFLEKKPWAMKVVDATGIRPPGFLHGQNLWLGSRDTCNAAQSSSHLKMSNRFNRSMEFGILNETAPFDVRFKIAYLDFETPWQVDWRFMPPEKTITWGLCLPASCSIQDIEAFMRFYIKSDSFVERRFLGIDATVAYVKDLGLDWAKFSRLTSVKILSGVTAFTAIMILLAMFRRSKSNESIQMNFISVVIGCFDIEKNLAYIFDEKPTQNEIRAISGMRSINANGIIFLHILLFSMFTCVDRTTLLAQFGRPLVGLFFIAVESFFVVSGFLLTYNFLRNQNQKRSVREANLLDVSKLLLKKLFHRWLRLAPPYYVVVCLNTALHSLVHAVSVYKLPARDDILIVDSWWRYLFFINNLQSHGATIAANWTWSMACEMQFFIIGTILLFVYAKNPKWGKLLYGTVVAYTVFTYFHNGMTSNFTWQYDAVSASISKMYFHTFIRIVPYLSGMFLAWYIVEKPFILPTAIEKHFGFVSLILLIVLLLPICDSLGRTSVLSSLILLLLRLFKALFNCWLILYAVKDRRTWLRQIFEREIFQKIGRLSYSIYLVNPIIVIAITSLTNMGFLFDWSFMIICTAGAIFLSKWTAVLFSLAFELPYCNLSKILLIADRNKKIS